VKLWATISGHKEKNNHCTTYREDNFQILKERGQTANSVKAGLNYKQMLPTSIEWELKTKQHAEKNTGSSINHVGWASGMFRIPRP
jgi:hypothetical protein